MKHFFRAVWCLTNSAPKNQRLLFFITQRYISSETLVFCNTTVKQPSKMVNLPFLGFNDRERIATTGDAFKKRNMIRQRSLPNAACRTRC